MKLREIVITLGYTVWWAAGGWLFGVGVNTQFGMDAAVICAPGNVIIGLLFLLPIVADERRRRLFYMNANDDESTDGLIGLLWGFPFTCLFLGLLWWLMGLFR